MGTETQIGAHNTIMNANVGRDCWNGIDGDPWLELEIHDFDRTGRKRMRCGILPVHLDHPAGSSHFDAKAGPEGSCEGDGQDHTDD